MNYYGVFIAGVLSFAAARADETVLLSIDGIHLGTNQYVAGFKINTWQVVPLAVCHFPLGWEISATKSIDASGRLSGASNGGVANIDRKNLGVLRSLYLVRVSNFRASTKKVGGEEWPASFAGTVSIGTFGGDAEDREVRLKPENFIRTPATRCPPPGHERKVK